MKIKKNLISKFISFLTILTFITGISNFLYGDNLTSYKNFSELKLVGLSEINSNLVLSDENQVLNPNLTKEYNESSFRRFEIIFFISLPISFLLSFGGTLLYKEISGNRGSLNEIEYSYLTLSSIGISFSVALRDYFITKRSIEK